MLKKRIHFQHMNPLTPSFHLNLKKISKNMKYLYNNIMIVWEQPQNKGIGNREIKGVLCMKIKYLKHEN